MTEMNKESSSPSHNNKFPYAKGWAVLAGAVVGLLLRLVFLGAPGGAYAPMGTVFVVLVPLAVGAVTVYLAERVERRSVMFYFVAGATANMFFVLGSLLILIEGLICAIVIIPVFGVYGGLGGLLMGAICRLTDWPKRAVYSFAALPLLLGAIPTTSLENTSIRQVSRSTVISAPPNTVWQQLLNAGEMKSAEMSNAWMYRIGVPTPLLATTQNEQGELIRKIEMGKNIRFEQRSSDWQTANKVRWTYRFTPESFPQGALDDHVTIGGRYFDVIDTTYALTDVPGGTRLDTSMTFRVTTEFNWYANQVGDFLVGNFAEVALDFYKRRAERSSSN
jgi:hypothetical protein